MINIYNFNETSFNHRGDILKYPLKCEINEQLNGIYELNLEYPLDCDDAYLLENQKILKVNNYDGTQLFRIQYIEKDLDTIRVYAIHISYDLLGNFIEDIYIQGMNGTRALHEVLNRSVDKHNFIGVSDITTLNNSRLVRKNTLEAIMGDKDNSLLSRWGGELYRDNFRINWLKKIGSDKGVTIKYAKNLTGIEYKIDMTKLVTHYMPKGFDGFLLPEKYVVSPIANTYLPIINRRVLELEDVISKKVSPEQEGAVDHDQALELLRVKAQKSFENGADKPEITCTVAFIDLSQTEEYKNYAVLEKVYLGDVIAVKYRDIDIKTRCVGYSYDCIQNRYINIQLGNTPEKDLISNAINSQEKLITKIQEIEKSNVEKAKEAIKESLNNGLGSNIKYYKDKLLILDTDDEDTARVVWKFNSSGLSVSTSGVNGQYRMATTNDGKFFAEIITGLKINSEMIEAGAVDFKHLSMNALDKFKEGLVTTEKLAEFEVNQERLRHNMSQTITKDVNTKVESYVNSKKEELKGQDGESSYVHIRYSNNPTGNPMTDDSRATYVGIYTGKSKTPPTNHTKYLWSKIRNDEKLYKGYANSPNGLDFTIVEPIEDSKLHAKNRPRVNIVSNDGISDIWQANMVIFPKPNTKYTLTVRAKGNNNPLWAYFRNNKTSEPYNFGRLEFGDTLETKSITFTTTSDVDEVLFKFVIVPEDESWEGVQVDWFTIYEGDKSYTEFPTNEAAQYHKYRYFGYTNKSSDPIASDFDWFDLQQKSKEVTNYTHIVYSDNSDGSDFGHAPKKYMGIARTNSRVIPKDKTMYKWFKIKGDDGHSLTANLRLEGSYLNNNLSDFKAYIDVYYDGNKVTSGFTVRTKHKGIGLSDWTEFSNRDYNTDGYLRTLVFSNGTRDGKPLEVIALISYEELNVVVNARLDNTINVRLMQETVERFKTFESNLDNFTSKLSKIEKKKYSIAQNKQNLCVETDKTRTGNDLYFSTKKLKANTKYIVLADVENAPSNQHTRIYNTKNVRNSKLLVNGLNIWEAVYEKDQDKVNIYPLGSNTKVSNVIVYEVTETNINKDNLYVSHRPMSETSNIGQIFSISEQVIGNHIYTIKFNAEGNITSESKWKRFSNKNSAEISEKSLVRGKNEWTFRAIYDPNNENSIPFFFVGGNATISDVEIYRENFHITYVEELNVSEMESKIDQKLEKIEHAVVKSSDFGTHLTQNAEYIKIAWNQISQMIQFEPSGSKASIAIYDGTNSYSNLRSKINEDGFHFYRSGQYIGKIGTNTIKGDSSKKGLVFDIEADTAYMTWAAKDHSSSDTYNTKWTYVKRAFGGFNSSDTLYASCDIDVQRNQLKKAILKGDCSVYPEAIANGITTTYRFVSVQRMDSDGTAANWSNDCYLTFKNGILVSSKLPG